MNALLIRFTQTCADAFPIAIGMVTYTHATDDERSRMVRIVKQSLLAGAAIGSGVSLGMFAAQYGMRTSLAFAATYLSSHTVAIGGWIVKGGVIWAVADVVGRRQHVLQQAAG